MDISIKPHLYYLIFDWETGGLSSKEHACVQLAMIAIRADNFEEIGRINTIIAPYGDYTYTEKALEINGVTLEEIIGGEDVKETVNKIIELAQSAKVSNFSKAVLVAHNADFDRNFTQQIFQAAGKLDMMPKIFAGSNDHFGNFQPHCIDTIDLAKMKWHKNDEEIANYQLVTCVAKAGVDLVGAHNALNDTISLRDLFLHFKQCIRNEGNSKETNESRFRESFTFEI